MNYLLSSGMIFRTEIHPDKPQQTIEHKDALMFMGSCFAQNMGRAFSDAGFNSLINPFGVVFNPVSVSNSLRYILEDKLFTESDLVYSNGLWHSWFHHGSFYSVNADDLLSELNANLVSAREFLKDAHYLVVTLGTAWVFQHKTLGNIVTNCHKVPSIEFNRFRLRVDEIVADWQNLLAELKQFNPQLQVVFTVSPVRHLADGAHGNQLSKATLILAVNELCELNNAQYFPAYELLLDDLRDYRFYDNDLVHPSDSAIDYIREKLFSIWLSPKSQQLAQEVIKLRKSAAHRPLHANSSEWDVFRKSIQNKASALKTQHPYLAIDDIV